MVFTSEKYNFKGLFSLPLFLFKEENRPLFPKGKPYLRVNVKHQSVLS